MVESSSNHLFIDAPAVLGSTFFWRLCKVMSEKHFQHDEDVPMVQLYTMSSKVKSAFYVIRRDDLHAIMDMYPKEVAPPYPLSASPPFPSLLFIPYRPFPPFSLLHVSSPSSPFTSAPFTLTSPSSP